MLPSCGLRKGKALVSSHLWHTKKHTCVDIFPNVMEWMKRSQVPVNHVNSTSFPRFIQFWSSFSTNLLQTSHRNKHQHLAKLSTAHNVVWFSGMTFQYGWLSPSWGKKSYTWSLQEQCANLLNIFSKFVNLCHPLPPASTGALQQGLQSWWCPCVKKPFGFHFDEGLSLAYGWIALGTACSQLRLQWVFPFPRTR